MASQPLTVRAKRDGIYGEQPFRQDEEFTLAAPGDFSPWWMRPVGWDPDEVLRSRPKASDKT